MIVYVLLLSCCIILQEFLRIAVTVHVYVNYCFVSINAGVANAIYLALCMFITDVFDTTGNSCFNPLIYLFYVEPRLCAAGYFKRSPCCWQSSVYAKARINRKIQ